MTLIEPLQLIIDGNSINMYSQLLSSHKSTNVDFHLLSSTSKKNISHHRFIMLRLLEVKEIFHSRTVEFHGDGRGNILIP